MLQHRMCVLITALIAASAGSLPSAAQTKKVAIGYASASDFLPAFIGKEKGCFEKRDLDVTLTRIPIVSNIPPALVAGSLQIGMSTATVLLQAVDGGIEDARKLREPVRCDRRRPLEPGGHGLPRQDQH